MSWEQESQGMAKKRWVMQRWWWQRPDRQRTMTMDTRKSWTNQYQHASNERRTSSSSSKRNPHTATSVSPHKYRRSNDAGTPSPCWHDRSNSECTGHGRPPWRRRSFRSSFRLLGNVAKQSTGEGLQSPPGKWRTSTATPTIQIRRYPIRSNGWRTPEQRKERLQTSNARNYPGFCRRCSWWVPGIWLCKRSIPSSRCRPASSPSCTANKNGWTNPSNESRRPRERVRGFEPKFLHATTHTNTHKTKRNQRGVRRFRQTHTHRADHPLNGHH